MGLAFSILLFFGAGTLVSDLTKIGQPVEVFSAAKRRSEPPPLPAALTPPPRVDR